MVISINNSEHYHWGNNCDGWHLLKSDNLSVIQERMPPATEELAHYHVLAQQVFYILSGTTTFVLDDNLIVAEANQSVIIQRGVKHSIKNLSNFDLHFLVISEPKAHGDRINI